MHRVQFQFQIAHPASMRFVSEDPLGEVWDQVSRFADKHHLLSQLRPDSVSSDRWDEITDYASIRVQQALEFREASLAAGPSTAALPQYYSMLNLTRAVAGLLRERECKRSHGLRFQADDEILQTSARVCPGTFMDYVLQCDGQFKRGDAISLQDCLANVAEIAPDLIQGGQRTQMLPARVKATASELTIEFDARTLDAGEFRSNWPSLLPEFATTCEATETEFTLRVKRETGPWDSASAAEYYQAKLLPRLIWTQPISWYAKVHREGVLHLPRPAYYLAAMFILSSIVRYQPEILVSTLRGRDHETAWILRRFLKRADRYYPQLMLEHIYFRPLLF